MGQLQDPRSKLKFTLTYMGGAGKEGGHTDIWVKTLGSGLFFKLSQWVRKWVDLLLCHMVLRDGV